MSEQKLREALERVAGMEDIEPCLACGSHHNLIRPEEDGDTSCYVREALSQPPTEGTPTETPLTDKAERVALDFLTSREGWAVGAIKIVASRSRRLERTLHAKERELAEANAAREVSRQSALMLEGQLATLQSVSAVPSGYVQVPLKTNAKMWRIFKSWNIKGVRGRFDAMWEELVKAATPTPSDSKPGEQP